MFFKTKENLVRRELFYIFVNLFSVKSLQISIVEDSWVLILAFKSGLCYVVLIVVYEESLTSHRY